MIIRCISAVIMLAVAFTAITLGSPFFEFFIIAVFFAAIIEFVKLTFISLKKLERTVFTIIGVIYLSISPLILIWTHNQGQDGMYFIIWLFCIICGTDIGGYCFGKYLGGAKLAPKISPNKTWAGFFGGISIAVILAGLFNEFVYSFENLGIVLAAGLVLSISGQFGDLIESAFKRKLAIKDTGTLIPGHGGVLDRIDSTLVGVPVGGVIAIIFQIGEIA